MANKGNKARVTFIKGESQKALVSKALSSTNVQDSKEAELSGIDGVIPKPYPLDELQKIVEISTILQQCIDAYKRNIVGFGAVPSYTTDDTVKDETPEMKTEWDRIKNFIRFFSFEKSFEDLMGDVIEDREQTGNGFMEIIRDGTGLPVSGSRLDPKYMSVCRKGDLTEVTLFIDGMTIKTKQRFRKYVQDIGTSKVFFKEVGDPRKMDSRNGEYVDAIEEQYEANEVCHFKIGSGTYGIPRWIGQLVHMYGSRKAEELNYNYFLQGRHTPMAVLLHNAILSPESETALQEYAESVQGVDNAHKFLLIEAEGLTEGTMQDEVKNAKVELKSLADMLQQDALFLEYDEASREKVQSAFRLPDLYVGRTQDFNRATADTARAITEEQVFEPERNSIEWVWNNKVLIAYSFLTTALTFKKPEISNSEEVVAVLNVANQIGAIAPNDVRDLIGKLIGKELEPLEGEQFDVPKGAMQAEAQIEGMKISNETAKNPPKEDPNAVPPKGKAVPGNQTGGKAPKPSAPVKKEDAYEERPDLMELKNIRDMLVKQYERTIGDN